MNNEKLSEALDHISDKHIAEAAKKPVPRRRILLGAIAAVLAAAIGIGALVLPAPIAAEALAISKGTQVSARPDRDDYDTRDQWKADFDTWNAQQISLSDTVKTARPQLESFFTDGSNIFLRGSGNQLWSPANAYIGLAMAAEVTGGNTRQQILDLLGAKDMENLRSQVFAVWESVYTDNGKEISVLANSLWLEDGLSCNQEVLDILSADHHASVYRGDLGSSAINAAIGAWLNNNTGGILKSATNKVSLPRDTVLALYSTLYFQGKWVNEFSSANNKNDVFHSPAGDLNVTYMNKKLSQMFYYWGDTYGAVTLTLKNGSKMWFILPDEGLTPEDVLDSGEYMQMILSNQNENCKYMKVNLSVPKFDVSGTQNLQEGLASLGITDAFLPGVADFSAITGNMPIYFTAANQSVRVQIDEQGVKAAAYIEFPGAGNAAPPEEIIDFILNRPFIFVITSDSIPLFAGVVNQP